MSLNKGSALVHLCRCKVTITAFGRVRGLPSRKIGLPPVTLWISTLNGCCSKLQMPTGCNC